MITELEKFQRVANSETFEQLLQCVEDFAVDGMIQGRTRSFPVQSMINGMKLWYKADDFTLNPNSATREFGIRGKMMEMRFYNK